MPRNLKRGPLTFRDGLNEKIKLNIMIKRKSLG